AFAPGYESNGFGPLEKQRPALAMVFGKLFCSTARARIEEKLGERLCENGLQLRHDRLDLRRNHVGIEGGLVGPTFEGQKSTRLTYDFHQRVDQATRFLGRRLGEWHQ